MQHRGEVAKLPDYTLSAKLTGDSSEFDRAVASANRAMDEFASRTKSIGKSISNLGSALTNKITKPAAVAATALAGVTLVKGFNRLKSIDEAKAKLTALGNSAEDVAKIMENANESVLGTSYALDEAATTAAGAVAAGIKPGQELTKYLTNAADAAAVAGTSMREMGSIFNKVQTAQRAYTEELNMLADRGLPIYQWLADAAGTTADAVRDMASKGQISSQMFFDAVEKNIGGAAQIIGETSLTGAIANINASLSRIGANFLDAGEKGGGFFSQIKPLLVELKGDLSEIEAKASELGEKFGAAFSKVVSILEDAKARFAALPQEQQAAITKSAGIGAVLAVGLGPGLQAIGSGVQMFGTFSSVASGAVNKVKGAFTSIPKTLSSVKNGISGLGSDFEKLAGIKSPFENGLPNKFGDAVSVLRTNLKGFFSEVGGALGPLISKIGSFSTVFMKGFNIAAVAGLALAGLGLLQTGFGDQINSMLATATTKGPQIITNLVNGIISALPNLIAQGGNLIITLIGAIQANLPAVVQGAISIVSSLVTGIAQQLPALIPAALGMVLTLVSSLLGNIDQLVDAGVSLLTGLADGLINAIPIMVKYVPTIIIKLVSALINNLPKLLRTGIQLLVALGTGLIDAIPQLLGMLPQIFSGIINAFKDQDWGQIGRNIIDGLINGLKSMVSSLWNTVTEIASDVGNWFKDKLGIGSPSKVFMQYGVWTDEGFAIGIDKGTKKIERAFQNMDVSGTFTATLPTSRDFTAANTAPVSSYSTDLGSLGSSFGAMNAENMNAFLRAVERGIGSMKVVANNREVGRFMTDIGFRRANA